MARISGVDLPKNKVVLVALTYIYGIGRAKSEAILKSTKIDLSVRTNQLTEEQVLAIRNEISNN